MGIAIAIGLRVGFAALQALCRDVCSITRRVFISISVFVFISMVLSFSMVIGPWTLGSWYLTLSSVWGRFLVGGGIRTYNLDRGLESRVSKAVGTYEMERWKWFLGQLYGLFLSGPLSVQSRSPRSTPSNPCPSLWSTGFDNRMTRGDGSVLFLSE